MYRIKQFENKVMIFATRLSEPTSLTQLKQIEKELSELNIKNATVIFDNLQHVGNVSNRFYQAHFENGKFIKESFDVLKVDKKSNIRKFSTEFYQNLFKENPITLNDSILTDVQKRIILKGHIL